MSSPPDLIRSIVNAGLKGLSQTLSDRYTWNNQTTQEFRGDLRATSKQIDFVTARPNPIHVQTFSYPDGLKSRQTYSSMLTPDPPISFGRSFIFGSPSCIRSFVSS